MASGDLTATRGNYSDYECNVFDGVDDFVNIENEKGMYSGMSGTVSAWINPRAVSGSGINGIVSKSNGGTAGNLYLDLIFGTGNVITFYLGNLTLYTAKASNAITTKQWHHVMAVWNGTNINIYIDGVVSGAAVAQGYPYYNSNNDLVIGHALNSTAYSFDGAIRSVKIWDKALDATERAADYAGTNPATFNLIHNFKLGGDYKDYGSGESNATNSGSIHNKSGMNQIKTDISQMNIAATTSMDNLTILPNVLGKEVIAFGVNRAA